MDPYEVLGVYRDADEETIKKAYRTLIKKYHPDKYVNTPMADMASEKTKEINKAYDMLTGKNQTGGASQSQSRGGYGGYGGYNPFGGRTYSYSGSMPPSFQNVRILLSMQQNMAAEVMLGQLDKSDAEWYYLYGIICLRKGWYDRAMENLKRACEMKPDNAEYADAYSRIINSNGTYRDTTQTTMGNDMCCDCPMPCCCWIPICGCPCGC